MANDHSDDKYYVPHSSPWPVFGSLSLFVLMLGAAMTVEQSGGGGTILAVGFLLLFVLFYGWFGKVVAEHQAGMFNMAVAPSTSPVQSCGMASKAVGHQTARMRSDRRAKVRRSKPFLRWQCRCSTR